MPRIGRPGSIRGEAARLGVSEYQIRKAREVERAAAEGRPPDFTKAAGKGSLQRRRDFARLNKVISPEYPKGSKARRDIQRAMHIAYDQIGFDDTRSLLILQGLNTDYYLTGYPNMITRLRGKGLRERYAGIPDAIFWYHGALG